MDMWTDENLDKPNFLKYNVHTPFQEMTKEKTKDISNKLCLPYALCLLNFTGDSNIGMSVRTAAVMGAADVYIIGKKKYDKRSAVGAYHYIKIHREGWLTDPCRFFEAEGYLPIIIEQGGQPLEDFDFRPYFKPETKPVLIMGSEGDGVDKDWLAKLKMAGAKTITISQCGIIRSLNVSVASSMVMYELCKQMKKMTIGHLALL
jgi:tRNA G18 (ribose-2'-O)-methylase SpoU